MERSHFLEKITKSFDVHPAVALLGPRQCGKTTLAKMYAEDNSPASHLDLEDPRDLARLDHPMLALEDLKGLIIIDEIQRRPELFPALRVLIDKHKRDQKYFILGSASRDLIRQSSESLAGRIGYIELTPFNLAETKNSPQLWLRGGFPPSYLSKSLENSILWRRDYIISLLEKEPPSLGIQIPPANLRRFWMMLVHYHGNIFNASEISRSLQISQPTVRRYLDILSGIFMIRQLNPWTENIAKRQVKSPKIYFRDSGLLHTFLEIETMDDLQRHPKLGASWEGFALEEIIRAHQALPEECYFWATHHGAELDLMIFRGSKRVGFEIKYTDSPKLTASMRAAMETLKLDSLTIIFPGKGSFPLAPSIRAIGLETFILG